MYMVVTPFASGTLDMVDLAGPAKRERLKSAVEDVEALYKSLSTHSLAHSIVSVRPDAAQGMIGNFHSIGRVDMRLVPDADFEGAAARTAAAVAEAVEHSALPAPLAAAGTPVTLPSGDLIPGIRFYMFSNHDGPVFAGVRRRRFRLHGIAPAPLSLSCIYGPSGRQDFVFSSTTAPQVQLDSLAATVGRHLQGG